MTIFDFGIKNLASDPTRFIRLFLEVDEETDIKDNPRCRDVGEVLASERIETRLGLPVPGAVPVPIFSAPAALKLSGLANRLGSNGLVSDFLLSSDEASDPSLDDSSAVNSPLSCVLTCAILPLGDVTDSRKLKSAEEFAMVDGKRLLEPCLETGVAPEAPAK
jgi:hypothetical protein